MRRDEFLSKNEVTAYLKISLTTLDRLIKRRALPFVKIGKRVIFKRADIDRFVESRTVRPRPTRS